METLAQSQEFEFDPATAYFGAIDDLFAQTEENPVLTGSALVEQVAFVLDASEKDEVLQQNHANFSQIFRDYISMQARCNHSHESAFEAAGFFEQQNQENPHDISTKNNEEDEEDKDDTSLGSILLKSIIRQPKRKTRRSSFFGN